MATEHARSSPSRHDTSKGQQSGLGRRGRNAHPTHLAVEAEGQQSSEGTRLSAAPLNFTAQPPLRKHDDSPSHDSGSGTSEILGRAIREAADHRKIRIGTDIAGSTSRRRHESEDRWIRGGRLEHRSNQIQARQPPLDEKSAHARSDEQCARAESKQAQLSTGEDDPSEDRSTQSRSPIKRHRHIKGKEPRGDQERDRTRSGSWQQRGNSRQDEAHPPPDKQDRSNRKGGLAQDAGENHEWRSVGENRNPSSDTQRENQQGGDDQQDGHINRGLDDSYMDRTIAAWNGSGVEIGGGNQFRKSRRHQHTRHTQQAPHQGRGRGKGKGNRK